MVRSRGNERASISMRYGVHDDFMCKSSALATFKRAEGRVMDRYYARSASDRTDNWPFWFVADKTRGGLNVTADLMRELVSTNWRGVTLVTREIAEWLAATANTHSPSERTD